MTASIKTKAAVCAVFAACAVLSLGFAFLYPSNRGENAQGLSDYSTQPEEYVVRNVDGYVCVFVSENMKTPTEKTNIQVETLRREDQMILEEGIRIYNTQDLLMLLEDLGS